MRRSRLSRSSGTHRRQRLDKVSLGGSAEPAVSSYGFGDAEIKASIQSDTKELASESKEHALGKVLSEIKEGVNKEYAMLHEKGGEAAQKLGGFMHELVYLDEDDAHLHGKNVEVAKRFVAQYPGENILLKAKLKDEPIDEAGTIGYVRAEDYLNFEDVEVAMPDGSVATIPRTSIVEFIGVSPHAAGISIPRTATSAGGLGTTEKLDETGVDEYAPSFHEELQDDES
jgi:hypothetical protein